jgi:putative SOS response-associated peptidase YedK
MCARYTIAKPGEVARVFPQYFRESSETRLPKTSRYNVAPTQFVIGVRNDGRDVAEEMKWGIHGRINIRAESVIARQSVRHRCIEFADGFYEWRQGRPFYFQLKSGEPFAFAGTWKLNGSVACDIITCEPNELVARVHDRMPVILKPDAIDVWLEPDDMPPDVAASMLQPYDARDMTVREVSKLVNNARNDSPELLEPAPEQPTLGLE